MKPKIIIDREPVSSEEILSRRNFGQLMSDAKLMQKPFFKSTWFISSMIVTLSTVALLVYFNIPDENSVAEQNVEDATSSPANTPPKGETTFQYAEDSPCIKPLLQGVQKEYSSVSIDPSKDALIHHPSGTDVIIPANSIVDQQGNPVTSQVEIRYREFHDIPEIMLSGIPMDYDSAGINHAFSSAGMIQIYGYLNGVPVKIKEGSTIDVHLASRQNGTQFNMYELNTVSGEWSYTGKDVVKNIPVQNTTSPVKKPELKKDLPTKYDTSIVRVKDEIKIISNQIAHHKKSKPEEPRKVDPNKYNFDIAADPNEFPELAKLGPSRFEVGSENKNFTAENYDIVWEDVKLLENEKGKNYKIRLIKGNLKKEYIVYPVYEGKSYTEAMQDFTYKFDSYNSALRKIEDEKGKKENELKLLNKKRDEEIRLKNEELQKKHQIELDEHTVSVSQQNNETANSEYLLRQYGLYERNGVMYNINANFVTSNATVAIRSFSMKGFGTVNSDHPKSYPNEQKVSIAFHEPATTKRLKPVTVFLAVPEDKMYFTYTPDQYFSFGFNPKKNNTLVAVMEDGKIGVINGNVLATIKKTKDVIDLSLTLSEKPVHTESYFRELTGL